MSRTSVDFLLYLAGRLGPQTAVSDEESALLSSFAYGRSCVVEVGVHQGATSAKLAAAMAASGCLWLIDPYFRYTLPERLLGWSFAEHIARRTVRPWADRVRFVRRTSTVAARDFDSDCAPQLIFIDADHSYAAVSEDFLSWAPHLAAGGALAFHDSRRCATSPTLDSTTGSVQLVDEILRGEHGSWALVAEAETLAVFLRGSD